MRRKTPSDYHALARTREFVWLGPEVPNTQTKTKWQCGKGHEWLMTYNMIQRGQGCRVCGIHSRAEKHRKKPVHYATLAKRRGRALHCGDQLFHASTTGFRLLPQLCAGGLRAHVRGQNRVGVLPCPHGDQRACTAERGSGLEGPCGATSRVHQRLQRIVRVLQSTG